MNFKRDEGTAYFGSEADRREISLNIKGALTWSAILQGYRVARMRTFSGEYYYIIRGCWSASQDYGNRDGY